jgi:hypothetical protein
MQKFEKPKETIISKTEEVQKEITPKKIVKKIKTNKQIQKIEEPVVYQNTAIVVESLDKNTETTKKNNWFSNFWNKLFGN